jgi:membrane dipeptidase
MLIVDAHEDIAYNMIAHGRDYTRSALKTREMERDDAPASARKVDCMLGLPEWLAGHTGVIFATIFAMPAGHEMSGAEETAAYTTPQEAFAQGMQQLDLYHRLADENPHFALVRTQRELDGVLATWQDGAPKEGAPEDKHQIGLVFLMEGADPIIRPQDVEAWYERGLRIVGPAWLAGTRYAGGDSAPGPLTDEGKRLLRTMLDFNMILDVSHLSDQACLQALDRYDGPVIASHSNPRAQVRGGRQLSNDMIKALLARDGVIGTCMYNSMLLREWRQGDRKDAVTLAHVVAAMDHICQMAGDAQHVGLGTDFDGGFGAESAPAELDTVADLGRVADALKVRGYALADVEAIMSGNWLRQLRRALP